MKVSTHRRIDRELCGEPVAVEPGRAEVLLETTARMAADGRGLVHGGFLFGAADYAAMLAVNQPYVVLGAAETRFLAPVKVGEAIAISAVVEGEEGRKRRVRVEARAGTEAVLSGIFTCFVLEGHVLGNRQ